MLQRRPPVAQRAHFKKSRTHVKLRSTKFSFPEDKHWQTWKSLQTPQLACHRFRQLIDLSCAAMHETNSSVITAVPAKPTFRILNLGALCPTR